MKTILIMAATAAISLAGSWKVHWNPNTPGPGLQYKVCKVGPADTLTPLGTTTGTSMNVAALPGEVLTVVAFNEFGDSPPADPITVPSSVTVEVQETFDLVNRKTVAILYADPEDGKKFEVVMETPKDDPMVTVVVKQQSGAVSNPIARIYRKKKSKAFYILKYYYGP